MVGSVNKAILLGNLGRDPEIRSMQSGAKMASFSIATSKVAVVMTLCRTVMNLMLSWANQKILNLRAVREPHMRMTKIGSKNIEDQPQRIDAQQIHSVKS